MGLRPDSRSPGSILPTPPPLPRFTGPGTERVQRLLRVPSARRAGRLSALTLLEFLLILVLIVAGLGDLPGRWRLGPMSLVGALTATGVLVLIPAVGLRRSYPTRALLRLSPSFAFLAWLGLRLMESPPDFYGLQQAAVHLLFALCLLAGAIVASRDPERASWAIGVGIRWMSILALPLVAISVVTMGFYADWLIGQRVVGLVGLVALAWYLSRLYLGVRYSLVWVGAWFGAIMLSASRTATASAILLLVLMTMLKVWRRPRGVMLAGALVFFAGASTAFLFLRVPKFRDHMLTGDTSIELGNVQINANGRLVVWDGVIRSARERPYVGHGMASSNVLVMSWYGIGHPHNDYLRLWHDVGLIGLGLFVVGPLIWTSFLARGWLAAERRRLRPPDLQLAGLLAVIALGLGMATDNSVVYAPVMASTGILIGAGLGERIRPRLVD